MRRISKALSLFMGGLIIATFSGLLVTTQTVYAAACTDHDTLGTGRSKSVPITVPATATYRVWVRMAVPSTTADSVLMSIDSNGSFCAVTAGGTGFTSGEVSDFDGNPTANPPVPPSIVWKWIDYRDGNTASKMDVSLTNGSTTTITVAGLEDGVAVDRIILVANNACTPSGVGDNCAGDTDPPVANPTFPGHIPGLSDESLNLSTGTIVIRDLRQAVIKPQVSDNTGVASALFTVNGSNVSLDASNNFTFTNANNDYNFRIQATDSAGNALDKTFVVKVRHPDISRSNSVVGYNDFTKLITQWGTNNPESDLNANGIVDYSDFVKLMTAWNE